MPQDKWAQYVQPADSGDKWAQYAQTVVPAEKGEVLPPEPAGFFENLGHAFGVGKEEEAARKAHPIASMIEETQPPVALAHALYSGGKRIAGEVGQAAHELKEGNPAAAAVHGVSAIPFVGPAMISASEQAPPSTPGESYLHRVMDVATNPGAMGTLVPAAAQTGAALLGGADMAMPERATFGAIPTRAKAGKLFQATMGAAGDKPVDLTAASEPLTRAFEMGERGMTRPKVVNQLMRRTTEPDSGPLTYKEARDYAQSLSRQSSSEGQKLTPAMKSQIGKLSHAFNEDVGRTAEGAGVGDQYQQAMQGYRRAMQLRHALINTAKVGGGALATGYLAHRLVPALLPER